MVIQILGGTEECATPRRDLKGMPSFSFLVFFFFFFFWAVTYHSLCGRWRDTDAKPEWEFFFSFTPRRDICWEMLQTLLRLLLLCYLMTGVYIKYYCVLQRHPNAQKQLMILDMKLAADSHVFKNQVASKFFRGYTAKITSAFENVSYFLPARYCGSCTLKLRFSFRKKSTSNYLTVYFPGKGNPH